LYRAPPAILPALPNGTFWLFHAKKFIFPSVRGHSKISCSSFYKKGVHSRGKNKEMNAMFLSLIQQRRSVRKYLDKPVEPEKVDLLVEAALRSPSSMGSNPWDFIVVADRGLLEKLSLAKPFGSGFLKNAPLAIVVCADPAKSGVWVEDASIASIFIHLAAGSLGLGSCWIQIRERMHDETLPSEAYISKLLEIPAGLKVEAVVAVGYPGETKPPHRKEDLHYNKVHREFYGRAYQR
jgi:nitroreductase